MIPCEPGDVLLVRFPFTDLTSSKKRPVVAVSSPNFVARYGDIVVLALTSCQQEDALLLEDWREAGLVKPTWIKPLVATLASTVLQRRMGSLSERDRKRVGTALRDVFADEFFAG